MKKRECETKVRTYGLGGVRVFDKVSERDGVCAAPGLKGKVPLFID